MMLRLRLMFYLSACMFSSQMLFALDSGAKNELIMLYEKCQTTPSPIIEHIPILRRLAEECNSVIEIGSQSTDSTWGLLMGLSENRSERKTFLEIELVNPSLEQMLLKKHLAKANGIDYRYIEGSDLNLQLDERADLLFIDSLHTYAHLTYELETFSPLINKYIVMHDTSPPWGYADDTMYQGNYSEYPASIDRKKRGLSSAVEDFLEKNPGWELLERRFNCHGLVTLKRIEIPKIKEDSLTSPGKSPHPISFSISETKIVQTIPEKVRDFAYIIPGVPKTYIYTNEKDYYQDYQRSYFAVTCKKAGWDCMRHYEILANGCIPYFPGLEKCDSNTMSFLPRELIFEAMNLPGVSYLTIDHQKFDKERYHQILEKLLTHTRNNLSSKEMAAYILKTINYNGNGSILFLSGDVSPDYLRCCTLIGLKELLGDRIVDYPKIEHIYKNYDKNLLSLYGKGISYAKVIDDVQVDRENIKDRIENKTFDLIVYGSVHRGMPYLEAALKNYPKDKIVYLCGEDNHKCKYRDLPNLFLREFELGSEECWHDLHWRNPNPK